MQIKKVLYPAVRRAIALSSNLSVKPDPHLDPLPPADGVEVSLIVPVYNGMPYFEALLASLEAQDLDSSRFEVIVVDDGSTDGTVAVADSFADRNTNFSVIHQANSGWPGTPRNRGMERATGRYLFFADADDILGKKSLRRLVDFANIHHSDVVLPEMIGLAGRGIPSRIYLRTRVDAPLSLAFKTFTPHKLIRRDLVESNALRFPEGKVRLEDGIFLSQVYLKAHRVSILAGYNYYYLRRRTEGSNISSGGLGGAVYVSSVNRIAQIIADGVADKREREELILTLFAMKCLKIYRPERFRGYSLQLKREWLEAHREFAERWIPPELEARMHPPSAALTALIRQGDLEGILRRDGGPVTPQTSARIRTISRDHEEFALVIELDVLPQQAALGDGVLLVTHRESGRTLPPSPPTAETPATAGPRRSFRAGIPVSELNENGTYDLHFSIPVEGHDIRSRVGIPAEVHCPGPAAGREAYRTVNGNLSLRVRAV
ncbi:glycosyltransferase [Saxibacter everestensis]|uniref:Glycosyltransferase n=1 Tax=Saxibacter everestensis TaxID=2909229 RepID=A0ABY8QTG5_9MICO|nr:glycosyltransferase [Brevibacteriaceae bacterium ZFBP1038]